MPLLRQHLAASAILFVASAASAGPPQVNASSSTAHAGRVGLKNAKLEAAPHRTESGVSVGSPTEGHLLGGAHLTESPYIRIVPVYVPGDARWGLEPLVSMIDRAARAVRKQFPDAVLSVGHLSRPGGGEIDRHASHESGRDADIGFYVKNQQHKPIYAEHFVPFKGDGTAKSWPGAEFDDARNWALVATIATDAHARVSHIFVAMPIRTRLLQYAEKIGASPEVRMRAAELMAQPRGSLPHDDHFHVRIGCPAGMEKCIEQPLARKHFPTATAGALARASGGHSQSKAHGAAAHASTSQASQTSQAHAAPRHGEPREEKSENIVPTLAPVVPGLDAAVIAVPLQGARAPVGARVHTVGDGDPTPPGAQPIDDPDGVLESP